MFLTIFLFCGLASVGLGFVAAIWFVGKCNHHATDDAVELLASDSDAELTREQALLASDRLADLTQQVTRDVNAHSTKVESISVTLCEAEPDSISGEPAVLIARDQLVAANAELQNQLARAESQIKAQAEQLRARFGSANRYTHDAAQSTCL
jgi:hypothetical protein